MTETGQRWNKEGKKMRKRTERNNIKAVERFDKAGLLGLSEGQIKRVLKHSEVSLYSILYRKRFKYKDQNGHWKWGR